MQNTGETRSPAPRFLALTGLITAGAIAALTLGGCNTARGIATDLSDVGDNIVETTEDIGRTLGSDDSGN